MESSSGAFEQGFPEGSEDDPFATADTEFEQSREEAERDAALAADAGVEAERTGEPAAEPAADLPVVDKEGKVVQPAAAAAEQVEEPTQVAADPPPPGDAGGEPSATAEATGEPGGTEAEAPTSASSEAPGAEAGGESEAEATAGANAAEPTEVEPEDKPEEVAAPPEEKGTKRQYKLFTPDGNGKFSEVAWFEKNGKVVAKGTTGAKRQTVVLARGQEEALRHGYDVLGRPQEGASLVAAAAAYFQVKRIEPDEVQPIRQRLRIS